MYTPGNIALGRGGVLAAYPSSLGFLELSAHVLPFMLGG